VAVINLVINCLLFVSVHLAFVWMYS